MAYLVIDIIDVFKGDPFPLIQVLFQLEGVLVKVLLQLLVSEVDTELLETTEEGRRGREKRRSGKEGRNIRRKEEDGTLCNRYFNHITCTHNRVVQQRVMRTSSHMNIQWPCRL